MALEQALCAAVRNFWEGGMLDALLKRLTAGLGSVLVDGGANSGWLAIGLGERSDADIDVEEMSGSESSCSLEARSVELLRDWH